MTPIAKNIRVVDEQGKEYEATYLKRAKGLVKNGRARFIDENTICLVCPPEIELEDNDMSDDKNNIAETTANPSIEETQKLTINSELEQIEKHSKSNRPYRYGISRIRKYGSENKQYNS